MPDYLEQAGVIPYRVVNDSLQVLLITSRSSGDWIVPKGMIDPGFTHRQAAIQEAYEEAGVRGELGPLLGHVNTAKGGIPVRLALFSLHVDEVFECWLEQSFRRRCWFSAQDAAAKVRDEGVSLLIQGLLTQSRL